MDLRMEVHQVSQKQQTNGVANDYGFTVFDPATANEAVTTSRWIKVEKITDTVAKRKEMLARATGGATQVITRRSSPKKPMQHQGTMTENRIGAGEGNRGLIPTRCSPRKHVQLQRKMTETDKGEANGGLNRRTSPGKGAASRISGQGHHVPEEGENNENNEPQSPITMNSSGSGYVHEDSMTKTPGTNEVTNDVGPKTARKKRSITTGKELTKLKKLHIKVPAEIHSELRRPVGLNSQMLITEEGCIVRGFAPLDVKKWGDIPKEEKKKLVDRVRDSFDIDTFVENDEAIIGDMGRLYRSHKYKLHKHFLKFRTKEEALRNKPGGSVTDAAWEYLCDHFSDPAFIKKSVINSRNVKARTMNHSSGTKSFARVSKELEMIEGEEFDRIQLWYETHFQKKKNKWIDEKSEEIYNKFVEVKENNEAEGGGMTMDEIFDSVLPPRKGYVNGLGPGPKPISKRDKLIMQQKEEAENRVRVAEQRNEELMKKVAELKARQDLFEERLAERMRAEMQNLINSVGLQHIHQSG